MQSDKPKCPKCRHRIGYEPQCGVMPPSMRCPICGWRDFDMKGMQHVNPDLLPIASRPK